jgi:hypothetical protein
MSFEDFDALVALQERQANDAPTLLRSAAEQFDKRDATGYADAAVQVRAIAALAATAASELLSLAGAYELAGRVSESGILEEP